MTVTTDYRAVSAAGALVATFQYEDQALKWARANRLAWPGLTVTRVTITTKHDGHLPAPALAGEGGVINPDIMEQAR